MKTSLRRRPYCRDRAGVQVREHTVLAERALGRPLPPNAEVHHHTDTQLVICPDHTYHMMLHVRQRALEECGNPGSRRCVLCGFYEAQEDLTPNRRRPDGSGAVESWKHRECGARRERERQAPMPDDWIDEKWQNEGKHLDHQPD